MNSQGNDNRVVRRDCVIFALSLMIVLAGRLELHGFWSVPSVKYSDMYFSADIGKNLVFNRGYCENRLLPRAVMNNAPIPTPYATKGLLHPLINAMLFIVFGISDRAAFLSSIPPIFLLILPIYRISNRLGGTALARLCVGLYVLDFWTAELVLSGLREPLYAWLLAEMISLLVSSAFKPYLLGIVGGLMYLTREFHAIPLLIIALSAWVHGDGQRKRIRVSHVVISVLTYAAMTGWWHYRMSAAGMLQPFYGILAIRTSLYPSYSQMVGLDTVSSMDFLIMYPMEFIRKVLREIPQEYGSLTSVIMNPLYYLILAASCLRTDIGRPEKAFRVFVTLSLAGSIALDLAVEPSARHFFLFVPLTICIVAREMVLITTGSITHRNCFIAAILLLTSASTLYRDVDIGMRIRQLQGSNLRGIDQIGHAIRRRIPAGTTVLTNKPWQVGWYADLPSIWLPYKATDLIAVSNKADVQWIVLVYSKDHLIADYDDTMATMVYKHESRVAGFARLEADTVENVRITYYLKEPSQGTAVRNDEPPREN
jgi:hypothetical protein